MSEVKRYQADWHGMFLDLPGRRMGTDERLVVLASDFDRVTAERDALQQLLNKRDEQIETMKQHQGEAVAWRYREGEGTQWRLTDMPPSTWYFDPRQYEVRNLYDRPAPAPVAVSTIQEDRGGLIAYGRSCGLDEASTLCSRLAYDTYYPAGSRFKHFIPKALEKQGNLLIKAANAIASLPGGPYDRFKARQAKKAESAKT
ncbi:hypothetical protein HKK58_05460 [Pseudomonas sp. ADAK22]|uniref:hypothetical protein n=1 Tax=Pseudomonas sp. ADAK22 TaxID=2730851 RepID=UPI0014648E1B|nr:hypothetical protein [Pseudomonas sp. ADAK22]QJI11998.1 hypothetical protein HKK58_05460 [Pseudomonas sp. ADAK22]